MSSPSTMTKQSKRLYYFSSPLKKKKIPCISIPLSIVKEVKMGEQRNQKKWPAFPVLNREQSNDSAGKPRHQQKAAYIILTTGENVEDAEYTRLRWGAVWCLAQTRLLWFSDILTYTAWWVKKTSNDAFGWTSKNLAAFSFQIQNFLILKTFYLGQL